MKEDFLDKRKIITMAKDLKEAAGIMVYPREDDSIDLSSFIVKKPPQKESVVLEITFTGTISPTFTTSVTFSTLFSDN
jgi:hypothetical protein